MVVDLLKHLLHRVQTRGDIEVEALLRWVCNPAVITAVPQGCKPSGAGNKDVGFSLEHSRANGS
jgi:hypothetical protein